VDCPEGYTASDIQGHCTLNEHSEEDVWPQELSPQPDCDDPAPPDIHQGLFEECSSSHIGDLFLSTQTSVDEFCDEFDCVQGGIDIGDDEGGDNPGNEGPGSSEDPIGNLTGLSCLKAARYLFVSNSNNLVNADFPSLVGLGGGLNFAGNSVLTTISAPYLAFAGEVAVNHNQSLNTLELDSLRAVLGFFSVTENPSLPTETVEAIHEQMCPQDIAGAVMIAGNG
jgi:hypothetical protein